MGEVVIRDSVSESVTGQFNPAILFTDRPVIKWKSPYCEMINFGNISPSRIFAVSSPTPIEDQDHPDLVAARDTVMAKKQKEINSRAKARGIEPMRLWDGRLPRAEQLFVIPDQMAMLVVGQTTFFRHVAYTEKLVYPLDGPVDHRDNRKDIPTAWFETTTQHRPNPLGSVLFLGIESGKSIMIGTPLAQTDEEFLLKAVPSGYSHLGGDRRRTSISTTITAYREMVEEIGVHGYEVEELSLVGRPFEPNLGKSATTLVYTGWTALTREEILEKPREEKDQLLFFPNDAQAFSEVLDFAPVVQGYLPGALLSLAHLQWGARVADGLNNQLIESGRNFTTLPNREQKQIKLELGNMLKPENIGCTIFETR